jgi:hypothetical protein
MELPSDICNAFKRFRKPNSFREVVMDAPNTQHFFNTEHGPQSSLEAPTSHMMLLLKLSRSCNPNNMALAAQNDRAEVVA